MKRRLLVLVLSLGVVAIATGIAVWALAPDLALAPDAAIPTAAVERGTLAVTVHLNGELQAGRTVSLTPPQAGMALRLVTLLETGRSVQAGDLVMAFDPADQQHLLEQNHLQVLEAEQEIIRLRADAEVRAAQADVELLTARFDVRRAEMDNATPAHLIGAIEARTRALRLEEARRRLAELEGSATSREAVDRASLATLQQRLNTANLTAARARNVIDRLEVRAPIDGFIVVRENRDTTNMFFTGMILPEYKVGDSVLQGRLVAEIIDTTQLLVRARVVEQDRPNLKPGQTARVHSDALGGDWLPARVENVAGLATRQPSDGPSPIRRFDVTLRLDNPERLRPGTSVRIVVEGPSLTDVLHVPRQAVVDRGGDTVVHVLDEGGFLATRVTVTGRNEGRVAIEGVPEGARVALLDPAKVMPQNTRSSGAVLE
jgi:multidrug resistance efflux pump